MIHVKRVPSDGKLNNYIVNVNNLHELKNVSVENEEYKEIIF